MPYLHIAIGRPVSPLARKALYERCAQLIETIPGKNQQNLMVRIEQDCDLYSRGGKAPCAFVDLRLYTPAPAEAKRAFAAALTRELCERFELVLLFCRLFPGLPGKHLLPDSYLPLLHMRYEVLPP